MALNDSQNARHGLKDKSPQRQITPLEQEEK
jgi:hypothetical protein